MKNTYRRPVLAVHGGATECTKGRVYGESYEVVVDGYRRIIPPPY